MRFLLPILALVTPALAHAAPGRAPQDILDRALAGRTAGKPVSCIYQRNVQSTEIIYRIGILYRMRNGDVLLNRPAYPESLHRDDVIVTRSNDDRLCNVDIVRLYDNGLRFPAGSVGLSDFVPYPKPRP